MKQSPQTFTPGRYPWQHITWGDFVIFIGIGVLVTIGVQFAMHAPEVIKGPEIPLSPWFLP